MSKKIGKNARENNEKYSPKNSGGKITVSNYCLWVIYELPYLLLSSLLPHLRHHFLNLTFFSFFPSPADAAILGEFASFGMFFTDVLTWE